MKFLHLLIVGFTLFCLSACSDDNQDLKDYFVKLKQRPPMSIDAVPPFKEIPIEIYQENDYRSPFQSKRVKQGMEQSGTPIRAKQSLESYPLDNLEMIGTLVNDEKMWALVVTPDGRVHRVAVGDYLGKYAGRVQDISKKEILVLEAFKNQWGEEVKREVRIQLKK